MRNRPQILTKQVIVRVPLDLHEAIQADAEANGRTFSQSVRYLLKQAIK